ncbi:hypothetical protein BCV72DRAFT_313669 [Rhizopus microsporus var. microsporus]|uniref:Cas12f1-like TNB domain-containing protein n=1 Tax=Rhizopus microsporus var. microsporus TaxID=86635 RepID=A0A1X0REI1_RHIZD|nr:hypothetical protein BCV72DRAFT_313669 [Rhizopus microsporus var. microsporus]
MYVKPQCHMKWLHFIQKEMKQKKLVQEMKPQDKASSSYVHRKLQVFPFVKKLNTSKYRSLKENTLTAINSKKALEITSKLRNIDKKDIDAVQNFIKTVQARIQAKTFMPLKYTGLRGSKYFSLLPLYKIASKSIQIDAQAFWRLAKQCDNKIKPGQKDDNDLTLWYFNVFEFSKIGYKTLNSLTSRPKKFAREPKTPKDFADIADDAEIWTVDPGISTIFTVDSTEHERIRTTSLEEYYHLCDCNLATRRRKEHQKCHLDEFKYISELLTLKTANLTSFLLAASTRLQNYQRIHNYCCQGKWPQRLKFKTYINKQKETQAIVKRLFDNSKKYDKSSTVGAKNQNKSKHVPLPPADLPSFSQRKRIIAFGNGSFGSNMKGKRAAPIRRITEEIKRKFKQSNEGTEFVSVDEYLTSQICNKCKSKQLNNISITGSKRRLHSVPKCESYGTVWNRDVNSVLNIYGIFVYKSEHDNEIPLSSKRLAVLLDLMRYL